MKKARCGRILSLGLAAVLFFAVAGAQAAVWTNTWTVGTSTAGRTNWNSSAIWVGGVVPGSSAGDTITFTAPANNATITNNYGNVTVGRMNFLAKPNKNYTLQKDNNNYGFTFNNNSNGASLANGDGETAGSLTIFNPITLADNLSITNKATTTGNISLSGSIGQSGGSRSISIYNTTVANGGVTLAASNSYSGGTFVYSGKLTASANYSLGAGGITVADGAALILSSLKTIDDAASLVLGSTASLTLSSGAETVGAVSLNGGTTWIPIGTYTAAQLGGMGTGTYSGTGSLSVTMIPEPVTMGMLSFGAFSILLWRRRMM